MKIVEVNLSDIRASLITNYPSKKIIKLEESPHYQFLLGNREPYIEYMKISHQKEHSVEVFEELIKNFNYLEGSNKNKFVVCNKFGDYYLIQDGFHRCCIQLYKGEEKIKIFVKNE